MKVQWHITERCNLRCKHCYHERYEDPKFPNGASLIEFPEWAYTINQIKTWAINYNAHHKCNQTLHVDVTGGEPFVHKDMDYLIPMLYSNTEWFTYGVMTNGLLITDKRAELLAKTNCHRVQVSLDGTEAVHDKIRGDGNFKKVLDSIKLLKDYGLFTSISFTATSQNYKSFYDVAQIVCDSGADVLWSDRLIPSNVADKSWALSVEQTKEYLELMHKAMTKFNFEGSNFRVDLCRALQFLMTGEEPYKCAAGFDFITLMPNGDVYPCRRLPINVGNIYHESLWDIWLNNKIMKALRSTKSECANSNCAFKNTCDGGLRCLSYAVTKDPFAKDPGCPIVERK